MLLGNAALEVSIA